MMKAIRQDVTYFGAANGFYGFRSNFDRIFSSEHLNKLFIIKGGPGTGKSTLLRKIKEKYAVDAKREWLVAELQEGRKIPEPENDKYSGQFKLRIPKSLHKLLAEHSKREGISMNQYCIYLLSHYS